MDGEVELVLKVLFLDVDGVLNTTRAGRPMSLSKGCLRRLENVVEETNCHLVLSSSWRKYDDAFAHLNRVLRYRQMIIISSTPVIHSASRGTEIAVWLNTHRAVERYAIVDDDSDMLHEQLPNFFQTDPDHGLSDTIAYRIIQHLKLPLPTPF